MNTLFSKAAIAIFVASFFISPAAHAGQYTDPVIQKERSGVSSALPYSVTTGQYQFTFYPRKAFVQPGQEIIYQLGISNRTTSSIPIRFVQVDVYRYMPYGITGFGKFKADSEVAIQNIEAEDFDVAGAQKKIMTFKIKVPSNADLGDKKEICIGAMMQSEQDSAQNQIATLNACTPIIRDAKQLSAIQAVFQKVYGIKAQGGDLEYWVPRYLREKMNAKNLESTMRFWKAKQGPVAPVITISSKDVPALFKTVFGRLPVASEQKYWEGRLRDKPTKNALLGAMSFQKAQKKSPKVLGVSTVAATNNRISVAQGATTSLKLPLPLPPSVKIELCAEGKTPEKCTLLLAKTSEKVPKVTIPISAPLGKAVIRVTARDKKGMMTKTVILRRLVLIEKGKLILGPITGKPANPALDKGRSFDIKLNNPYGKYVMSKKAISPIYVTYEDDWTTDEKAYACKIGQWTFEDKSISSSKWRDGDSAYKPQYKDGFCKGYLDFTKFPSDVHRIGFTTQTPGGRLLSAKATLNLTGD